LKSLATGNQPIECDIFSSIFASMSLNPSRGLFDPVEIPGSLESMQLQRSQSKRKSMILKLLEALSILRKDLIRMAFGAGKIL
jgi:hypothetical protein